MQKNRFERRNFSSHQLMVRKWFADGGDSKFRFNYDLDDESIVLDLGGYRGQWASDLYSRYRCNIFIFEPVGYFVEQIRARFKKNNQIEIFPYGIGGKTRSEKIHISGDGSSIFGTSKTVEDIKIVDVKEWINKKKIGKIDLAKINIEGGEYELLERLIETNMIGVIKNIQVQFHNISHSSCYQMEQIQKELRKTHVPTYQYKFVWENWRIKI